MTDIAFIQIWQEKALGAFLSSESLCVPVPSAYATITLGARLPFVKIRISR
jgi:hypothetical protein